MVTRAGYVKHVAPKIAAAMRDEAQPRIVGVGRGAYSVRPKVLAAMRGLKDGNGSLYTKTHHNYRRVALHEFEETICDRANIPMVVYLFKEKTRSLDCPQAVDCFGLGEVNLASSLHALFPPSLALTGGKEAFYKKLAARVMEEFFRVEERATSSSSQIVPSFFWSRHYDRSVSFVLNSIYQHLSDALLQDVSAGRAVLNLRGFTMYVQDEIVPENVDMTGLGGKKPAEVRRIIREERGRKLDQVYIDLQLVVPSAPSEASTDEVMSALAFQVAKRLQGKIAGVQNPSLEITEGKQVSTYFGTRQAVVVDPEHQRRVNVLGLSSFAEPSMRNAIGIVLQIDPSLVISHGTQIDPFDKMNGLS